MLVRVEYPDKTKYRAASNSTSKQVHDSNLETAILGVGLFEYGEEVPTAISPEQFEEIIQYWSHDVRWFEEELSP